MSHTFVLIHGAWHDGSMLEPLAQQLRAAGHTCFVPTLLGNRVGDDRSCIGFHDVVKDLVLQIQRQNLQNFYLLGHSFGGMVISQLAQIMPERIKGLIYCSAFVPKNGECVFDLLSDDFVRDFREQSLRHDQELRLNFSVWRQLFTNETPADIAKQLFKRLNAQAFGTFKQSVVLNTELNEIPINKWVILPLQDMSLPKEKNWHPYFSSRLGVFRLLNMDGDHELVATQPHQFAQVVSQSIADPYALIGS
jgi:pimeloyl-ACP methyl ester carboxylesterase